MAQSNGIRPAPKPSGKKGSKKLTPAEEAAVIARIKKEGKVTVPTVDASPPKKVIGGKIVPKAEQKKAAKREKSAAPAARRQKYVDHGEGAKQRYFGISWDGSHLRTTNGSRGLERSTDEGKTWKVIYGDEFEVGNRDRWRRAIEKSAHKKPPQPYPAVGAASWLRPRGENGEKLPREKSARQPRAMGENSGNSLAGFSLMQGLPAKDDRERSIKCQFDDVVKGHLCKSESVARVTSGDKRRSADLCAKHEAMVLATKCDLWNPGAVSKPLPKIVPAPAPAAAPSKAPEQSKPEAKKVSAPKVVKPKAAAKKSAKLIIRAKPKTSAKRKASKR